MILRYDDMFDTTLNDSYQDAKTNNDTIIRMNVNQTTFAILISILLVADIFLVWSFGYIVVFYEKRGRIAWKHFGAVRRHKRPSVKITNQPADAPES